MLVASYHEGAGEGLPNGTLEKELAEGGTFKDIVEQTCGPST